MLEYIFSWLFASIFGYVIPWWFYPLMGAILAAACFVILPFGVDGSMRLFIAQCVLAIGVCLGALSWGVSYGIGIENARWLGLQNAEIERVKAGLEAQIQHETARRALAEATVKNLKETLRDLDKEADAEQDASALCVSEPIANRLRSLSRRPRNRGDDG